MARNGSDEYLNAAFGWIPFLQDIRDFINVTRDMRRQILQFNRDSGRWIRRRYTIVDTHSVTSTELSGPFGAYPYPPVNAFHFRRAGALIKDTHTSRKVWFSGAFTYHIPNVNDTILSWLGHYEAYAHRFYGLRLDPDLLWRVAPWSWAADWFLNTGAIARNWSAFTHDGLVMPYGYVMERLETRDEYRLIDCLWSDGSPAIFQGDVTSVTKSRKQATPFGFGLNPATFTPRQVAITAALGINRFAGWR